LVPSVLIGGKQQRTRIIEKDVMSMSDETESIISERSERSEIIVEEVPKKTFSTVATETSKEYEKFTYQFNVKEKLYIFNILIKFLIYIY